jgi:hypothetical protein
MGNMTVSISIPEELAEKIKKAASLEHRSFSGQVAFFCDQGVRHLGIPRVTPHTKPRPALARNDMGGLCVAPDPVEPEDREMKA